jgi:nucleoside-diphosphate-sugar epimerase
MRALLVGGTGPTGPHVVRGLLDRGHDVTIFHRGTHEVPELDDVEHLHGDPHFPESITAALGDRGFDTVIASYGRVEHLAEALVGRCDRFVSVGGVPVYQGFFSVPGVTLPIPVTEEHPVVRDDGGDPALRFSRRLADAEDAVFAHHPGGTVLRFSTVYGPHNPRPAEWSIVRRVRDGRRFFVLPDGGLQVHSRCAARNAAAFVLAAVDRPDAAAGEVFNCGDATSWSMREWVDAVLAAMRAELELVAVPSEVAIDAATTLMPLGNTTAPHVVVSTEKARRLLGYEQVVEPPDAIAELVDWYAEQPDFDASGAPSFTDRFDYATEDALVDAYRGAVGDVQASVEQHAAPPVHSMPHPREAGAVDHRGR